MRIRITPAFVIVVLIVAAYIINAGLLPIVILVALAYLLGKYYFSHRSKDPVGMSNEKKYEKASRESGVRTTDPWQMITISKVLYESSEKYEMEIRDYERPGLRSSFHYLGYNKNEKSGLNPRNNL